MGFAAGGIRGFEAAVYAGRTGLHPCRYGHGAAGCGGRTDNGHLGERLPCLAAAAGSDSGAVGALERLAEAADGLHVVCRRRGVGHRCRRRDAVPVLGLQARVDPHLLFHLLAPPCPGQCALVAGGARRADDGRAVYRHISACAADIQAVTRGKGRLYTAHAGCEHRRPRPCRRGDDNTHPRRCGREHDEPRPGLFLRRYEPQPGCAKSVFHPDVLACPRRQARQGIQLLQRRRGTGNPAPGARPSRGGRQQRHRPQDTAAGHLPCCA